MIPSGWNNIFNPCQSVELLERSEKSVVKKNATRNPQLWVAKEIPSRFLVQKAFKPYICPIIERTPGS